MEDSEGLEESVESECSEDSGDLEGSVESEELEELEEPEDQDTSRKTGMTEKARGQNFCDGGAAAVIIMVLDIITECIKLEKPPLLKGRCHRHFKYIFNLEHSCFLLEKKGRARRRERAARPDFKLWSNGL